MAGPLPKADNELGVETVRVRPCRRGRRRPEQLIGQSVGAFECECVSLAVKIVCSGQFNEIIPKLMSCHDGF